MKITLYLLMTVREKSQNARQEDVVIWKNKEENTDGELDIH